MTSSSNRRSIPPVDARLAILQYELTQSSDWSLLPNRSAQWLLDGMESQEVAQLAGMSRRTPIQILRHAFESAIAEWYPSLDDPLAKETQAVLHALALMRSCPNAREVVGIWLLAHWSEHDHDAGDGRFAQIRSYLLMFDEDLDPAELWGLIDESIDESYEAWKGDSFAEHCALP